MERRPVDQLAPHLRSNALIQGVSLSRASTILHFQSLRSETMFFPRNDPNRLTGENAVRVIDGILA